MPAPLPSENPSRAVSELFRSSEREQSVRGNGIAISWGWKVRMSGPKSAYELAMEKLRKKDAEAGVEEQVLTEAQRQAISEARSLHDARVAERRILHQSTMLTVVDPAERDERESELRRDLEHLASERDAKIRRIRSGE